MFTSFNRLSPARWAIVFYGVFVICTVTGFSNALHAEERAAGPYTLGTLGTLFDQAPTTPGLRAISMALHFEGQTPSSTLFPVAGVVTAGLTSRVNLGIFGLVYTFEQKVLGASYSAGVYGQLVDSQVTAQILSPNGAFTRTDSVVGPGDTFLVPAILAWTRGPWQVSAVLPIRTPTGEFRKDRLINAGTNAFAIDPLLGLSYLNESNGFGASIIGGVTINGENPDTNYRSGSTVHLEGSVQQHLPVGPGVFGFGITGAWLHQITDDTGSGANLGDFRARAIAAGPVFDYIVSLDNGQRATVEFKWLPELDTKNRVEGDYFWFRGALEF